MKFKDEVKKTLQNRRMRIQLLRSRITDKINEQSATIYQINYLQEEKRIQNILRLLD